MEFPYLGKNCSMASCNKLDFLPVKCDACNGVFCHDHMSYTSHMCEIASSRNVQVPVCPLCNKPVPSKRDQPPDIAVGAHIDRYCKSDPAIDRRKVFTQKCGLKGCKKKEMIPILCSQCRQNYCITHRHPSDHNCAETKQPKNQESRNHSIKNYMATTIPEFMTEEEALKKAIELSLQEQQKSQTHVARAGGSDANNKSCHIS